MKLYSHWRSLATFRVRIALYLKDIEPDRIYVDLSRGEQRSDAYRQVNPEMVLPALLDGDGPPLVQSLAIIEYLDETRPEPPLLPAEPRARARARALAQIVAADSHPLIVPRVRSYLERDLGLDEAARLRWIRTWIGTGLDALEAHLAEGPAGAFCVGDRPTIADICLVSQVVGAGFFKLDLAPYPRVRAIADRCLAIDAFARAHPLRQPDAPPGGVG